MKMHKTLHPRDDIDILYVSRNEGGRGLASIEDCVYASTKRSHKKEQRKINYSDKKQTQRSTEQQ